MNFENLDSRDLEERLNELLDQEELNEEEKQELKEIQDLKEETDGYGWEYGIYFINEVNFQEYCDELADECYINQIPDSIKNYFDYEAFARDCEHDYSYVTFRGEDYLYREA